MTWMPYLLSLVAGLGAGVIYGLFSVRSPAPPIIALLGLLGVLAGEAAVHKLRGTAVIENGAVQSSSVIGENTRDRSLSSNL